jgi:hypothetical protein
MNKKNKTEEIINDKLNNREFTFDEKAWAGVENLLDAQEKKRKRAAFWWFSAAMLLVLVAGASYYYSQKSTIRSQKLEVENVTPSVVEGQKTLKTADFEEKQGKTKENTAIPNELATIPNELAAVPKELAVVPNVWATIPKELATIPNEVATIPNEVATIPNEMAAIPNEMAAIPNEVAAVTNEVATIPTEVATAENEQDSAKTAAQTDSVGRDLQSQPEEATLTPPGKETKNAWGIMAGVGGWSSYGEAGKNGLGFTGGVYYQMTLSKRFELGLSILYTIRGGLNTNKLFVNSNYGFGIESDITFVSAQTLHYINIPLSIRFNISQRSHIYIGAAYYQLLATTSKITHQTENSFGVIESDTKTQTGEHAGFRNNDVVAFLGYDLTLFSRMNAGLQINYGFCDNVNNSYYTKYGYTPKEFDRNMGIQLHLKYDLIRH